MIDLDELERLEKAATPGPWHAQGIRMLDFGPGVDFEPTSDLAEAVHADIRSSESHCSVAEHVEDIPSAVLIAAARNAMPALIRELRAAREALVIVKTAILTSTDWEREAREALIAYDEAAQP